MGNEQGKSQQKPPANYNSGESSQQSKAPSKNPLVQLQKASYEGNIAEVTRLLKKGVNFNGKDSKGRSAIYWAAWNGHLDIVTLLLEKNADLEATDDEGMTALHKAVATGNVPVAKVLCDKGAKLTATDVEDRSPLHLASYNGDIGMAVMLMDHGAKLDTKDVEGRTPLHYAAYNGFSEFARQIIKRGAPLNARDNGQRTPLIYASNNGYADVVKALVENGADIYAEDDDGKNAGVYATLEGQAQCIRQLRKYTEEEDKEKEKEIEKEKKEKEKDASKKLPDFLNPDSPKPKPTSFLKDALIDDDIPLEETPIETQDGDIMIHDVSRFSQSDSSQHGDDFSDKPISSQGPKREELPIQDSSEVEVTKKTKKSAPARLSSFVHGPLAGGSDGEDDDSTMIGAIPSDQVKRKRPAPPTDKNKKRQGRSSASKARNTPKSKTPSAEPKKESPHKPASAKTMAKVLAASIGVQKSASEKRAKRSKEFSTGTFGATKGSDKDNDVKEFSTAPHHSPDSSKASTSQPTTDLQTPVIPLNLKPEKSPRRHRPKKKERQKTSSASEKRSTIVSEKSAEIDDISENGSTNTQPRKTKARNETDDIVDEILNADSGLDEEPSVVKQPKEVIVKPKRRGNQGKNKDSPIEAVGGASIANVKSESVVQDAITDEDSHKKPEVVEKKEEETKKSTVAPTKDFIEDIKPPAIRVSASAEVLARPKAERTGTVRRQSLGTKPVNVSEDEGNEATSSPISVVSKDTSSEVDNRVMPFSTFETGDDKSEKRNLSSQESDDVPQIKSSTKKIKSRNSQPAGYRKPPTSLSADPTLIAHTTTATKKRSGRRSRSDLGKPRSSPSPVTEEMVAMSVSSVGSVSEDDHSEMMTLDNSVPEKSNPEKRNTASAFVVPATDHSKCEKKATKLSQQLRDVERERDNLKADLELERMKATQKSVSVLGQITSLHSDSKSLREQLRLIVRTQTDEKQRIGTMVAEIQSRLDEAVKNLQSKEKEGKETPDSDAEDFELENDSHGEAAGGKSPTQPDIPKKYARKMKRYHQRCKELKSARQNDREVYRLKRMQYKEELGRLRVSQRIAQHQLFEQKQAMQSRIQELEQQLHSSITSNHQPPEVWPTDGIQPIPSTPNPHVPSVSFAQTMPFPQSYTPYQDPTRPHPAMSLAIPPPMPFPAMHPTAYPPTTDTSSQQPPSTPMSSQPPARTTSFTAPENPPLSYAPMYPPMMPFSQAWQYPDPQLYSQMAPHLSMVPDPRQTFGMSGNSDDIPSQQRALSDNEATQEIGDSPIPRQMSDNDQFEEPTTPLTPPSVQKQSGVDELTVDDLKDA